jgi:hypothetical protein
MYSILMVDEQYSFSQAATKTRVRLARAIKNNDKGRMFLADYLICEYTVAAFL